MLSIGKPIIKECKNDKVRLTSLIEIDGVKKELWIEINKEYEKYLVTDRADAFLIGLLPMALKHHHDIQMKCPISEELLHNVEKILIPTLALHVGKIKEIKISATEMLKPVQCLANAVGTGFSRGVDSMHALCKYINPKWPSYKLTHLLIHDVGAFDMSCYEEQGIEKTKKECFELSFKVADELKIPYIFIKTNLALDFQTNYGNDSTYSNLFTVFAMQKFWKTYYLGSGWDFSLFRIKNTDMKGSYRYELLLIDVFSLSNLRIYSEGGETDRLGKTRAIADFEPAQKYLNVCFKGSSNCNVCRKCNYTLLALDALDKLDNFKKVFDIDYYRHNTAFYFNFLEEDLYTTNDKNSKYILNLPTLELFRKKEMLSVSPPKSHIGHINFPDFHSYAIYVKNLTKNADIFEKNIKRGFSGTAISKLMAGLIALESKKVNDLVDVDENNYEGIKKISLKDLASILLIGFKNDPFNVIAKYLYGSKNAFVVKMNEKAKEIGLSKDTNFAADIISDDTYTTAQDVCKFLEYAVKNKDFCNIMKKKEIEIKYKNSEFKIENASKIINPLNTYHLSEIVGAKYSMRANVAQNIILYEKAKNLYAIILLGVKNDKEQINSNIDARILIDGFDK